MRIGQVEPEGITTADTLGNIEPGDLQQGDGVSTLQLSRVTVNRDEGGRAVSAHYRDASGKSNFGNMMDNLMGRKSIGGASLGVWAVFVLLLISVKYFAEKAGERSEFSSVRIGLENWFVVGGLALTFAYVFKMGVALLPTDAGWAMALREFAGMS